METLALNCPSCKKKLKVNVEFVGKRVACKCGQKILVPELPPAASASKSSIASDFELPTGFETKSANIGAKNPESWETVEEVSEGAADSPKLHILSETAAGTPPHPMISLYTLAIATGLLASSLIYAMTWKFAAPVWAYGSFLIPISVTLLVLSYYAFSKAKTDRLSRLSVLMTSAFCAITFIAGIGTIYDVWTIDQKFKNSFREVDRMIGR